MCWLFSRSRNWKLQLQCTPHSKNCFPYSNFYPLHNFKSSDVSISSNATMIQWCDYSWLIFINYFMSQRVVIPPDAPLALTTLPSLLFQNLLENVKKHPLPSWSPRWEGDRDFIILPNPFLLLFPYFLLYLCNSRRPISLHTFWK